jgi:hypothetical protein
LDPGDELPTEQSQVAEWRTTMAETRTRCDHFVAWFFGGAFLANAIPHLVRLGRVDLRQTKHLVVLGFGILVMALMLAHGFGRFHGGNLGSLDSVGHTWVWSVDHGDKPGNALVLIEKAGAARSGKFYILDPNHTRDLSRGNSYDLRNVRHEGKTIAGDVSLIDGSSKTGAKNMHLTITLKEAFDGERVQAELQADGGTKQPIEFVRQKGG